MINDCFQRFFLFLLEFSNVLCCKGRCVHHRRTRLKCRTQCEPVQLRNSCEAQFALRLPMSLVFYFSRFWRTSWIIRYAMNETQFKDGRRKCLKIVFIVFDASRNEFGTSSCYNMEVMVFSSFYRLLLAYLKVIRFLNLKSTTFLLTLHVF